MADVARTAGVSSATVSRVVNRQSGVSAEVTAAVRQAMRALRYQPPPLDRRPGRRARSRADQPGAMIAVVVLDRLYTSTPGVLAAHLKGVQREAAEHGLNTIYAEARDAQAVRRLLAGGKVIAAALFGAVAEPGVLEALGDLPYSWANSHQTPAGGTVMAGNEEIARLAVEYLAGRGRRSLAFLSAHGTYPAYTARARAFRFHAQEAGFDAQLFLDDQQAHEPLSVLELPEMQRRVYELVGRLARSTVRPDGLFIPNDAMTAMAYVALRREGLEPGRDLDAISCNNEVAYLIGLSPRPATIDIGAELIGRQCVGHLLRRIRSPAEGRRVQVAVSPVVVMPE